MNDKPLISIITVVYNGEKFLEKTIQSVINQTYKNIEYIIIDGGSTDGTVDIIKKYEKYISHWVSERDEGIYDAMNKGMEVASGDFATFMNGGDSFYEDGVIESVVEKITDREKVYFGRAENISNNSPSWLHPDMKYNQKNIQKWLIKQMPNHQAMFFPKCFFKKYKYDLKYKIFADAVYKNKAKKICGFIFVDLVVCRFELGGVSSAFDKYTKVMQMMREVWWSREEEGYLFVFKRIIIYNIKYIVRYLFKDKYYNFIRNMRIFK